LTGAVFLVFNTSTSWNNAPFLAKRSGSGDARPAKWQSVTRMPDDDTIVAHMYVGGEKDPAFTITYRRKK
jgi:hypothetical protein